jgi:hypothetical protein
MPQEQSFYEGHSFYEGLTWWFIRERIGHGLKQRYEVPKELPPNLLALVRKLEVGSNQLRSTDYARTSGIKAFPDWFVRT